MEPNRVAYRLYLSVFLTVLIMVYLQRLMVLPEGVSGSLFFFTSWVVVAFCLWQFLNWLKQKHRLLSWV